MAVTSHGFDAGWNLQPIFLGGRYSPESHTGVHRFIIYNFVNIEFQLRRQYRKYPEGI